MTKLPEMTSEILRARVDALAPGRGLRGALADKKTADLVKPFRDMLSVIAQESRPKPAVRPESRAPTVRTPQLDVPTSSPGTVDDPKEPDVLDIVAPAKHPDIAASQLKLDMVSAPNQPQPPVPPVSIRHEAASADVERSDSVLETLSDVVAAKSSHHATVTASNGRAVSDLAAQLRAGPADDVQWPDSNVPVAAAVDARPRLPPKLVVLQQETHFEPVSPNALPQKIADIVATEMKGQADQASLPAAPNGSSSVNVSAGKPMKILTLQLDPASLGTVTVKLRLAGDTVEVQLTAARHETVQLLQQQRDALTGLMRSAGYTADVALVQHGGPTGLHIEASQQATMQPLHQQVALPSQGTLDTSGLPSGDAQGGGRQHRNEPQREQERRHGEEAAPSGASGFILL